MEHTITLWVTLGICIPCALGIVGLLWLAARNTLRDPQRQQRLRALPRTIDAIAPGETVVVVGLVEKADIPLTAPFSGKPCVGYHAAIENDVDAGDPDAVLGGLKRRKAPHSFVLRDETGTVVVRPSPDSPLTFERRQGQTLRAIPMADVDRFLAQWGAGYDDIESGFPFGVTYSELPSDYRAVEWLLVEGDRLAVIGQVAHEPAAQGASSEDPDARLRLEIGPEPTLPVQLIARPSEIEALAKRRTGRSG